MTTIGIIAALSVEVDDIKRELKNEKEVTIAKTTLYSGQIGQYNVITMQCGMGKVSAALGTQTMIDTFHPDYIINTGCAGAIKSGLQVGDIVLSTSTVEWDLDTIEIGNPRGYVSAMDRVEMKADETLIKLLESYIPKKVYKGVVASGDQFVSKDEQRKTILSSFPDALCAEMEGGAVGHVCAQNKVPFCILRSMSDTADGNSGVDFASFAQKAGEQSAAILLSMLKGTL